MKYLKHKNFKDVCVLVESDAIISDKLYVTGKWVNLGANRSYSLDEPAFLLIGDDELEDWAAYDGEEPALREVAWLPFTFS